MAGTGGGAPGAGQLQQQQHKQQEPAPLSFSDFLERMKEPAAADLVRAIKAFIRQFEERGAGHWSDPEADSARVQVGVFWRHCSMAVGYEAWAMVPVRVRPKQEGCWVCCTLPWSHICHVGLPGAHGSSLSCAP